MRKLLPIVLVAVALVPLGAINAGAARDHHPSHRVTVPEADQFLPFALIVHVGDPVGWVNHDGDDHTVVSDDAFNSAGHKGFDQVLPASGGTLVLRFNHPGTFVYYCRFHAQLDAYSQPIAPGPDGGIQDQDGNFGTPMSGVITVLPNDG